jgi:predicted transcriptional regulator
MGEDKAYPEEILWRALIRNLRNRGLSQVDIAMQTGFNRTDIALMEQGAYEPPFLSILKLLDLHHDLCRGRHHLISREE